MKINEWIAPGSNNAWTQTLSIDKILETIAFNAWASYQIRAYTLIVALCLSHWPQLVELLPLWLNGSLIVIVNDEGILSNMPSVAPLLN